LYLFALIISVNLSRIKVVKLASKIGGKNWPSGTVVNFGVEYPFWQALAGKCKE